MGGAALRCERCSNFLVWSQNEAYVFKITTGRVLIIFTCHTSTGHSRAVSVFLGTLCNMLFGALLFVKLRWIDSKPFIMTHKDATVYYILRGKQAWVMKTSLKLKSNILNWPIQASLTDRIPARSADDKLNSIRLPAAVWGRDHCAPHGCCVVLLFCCCRLAYPVSVSVHLVRSFFWTSWTLSFWWHAVNDLAAPLDSLRLS